MNGFYVFLCNCLGVLILVKIKSILENKMEKFIWGRNGISHIRASHSDKISIFY